MKKIMLVLLAVCAVNMHAVNVYVGGEIVDGSDRIPVYWQNGKLSYIAQEGVLPEGLRYESMAVENGTVYMCMYQPLESRTLYNKGEVRVYKSGGTEISSLYIENARVASFALSNGKAYISKYSNWYKEYTLYKNETQVATHAGKRVIAVDGILYYTLQGGDEDYNTYGFYAGGYEHRVTKMGENFRVNRIRVINDDVYLIGRDDKGACYQINDRLRVHTDKSYGSDLKDVAKVSGEYYYIVGDKLFCQKGQLMMQNLVPLQIIGRGDILYVLCKNREGAVPKHYIAERTPEPNGNISMSLQLLPSCVNACDFYVEE